MSASQERQPTLISIAPRFPVADMEQALAFYAQLGFATTIVTGSSPLSNEMGSVCTSMCPKVTRSVGSA
jgi:hypothetical protein